MASLFTDFLSSLGVKHTEDYSDKRFSEMPFQSMFGLANLLKEYGVGTAGIKVATDSAATVLPKLPLPFLADTPDGFLIVTKVENGTVGYISQGKPFTATTEEILDGWNGVALLAAADSDSEEPEYLRHEVAEKSKAVKRWLVRIMALALLGFAMWSSGLYSRWEAWLLAAFDCVGIALSWMLVQKSLGIQNKAADAVCSVLEEGGCDELAKSESSSFFGIFKWSEVGLSYFSVSLLAMLLFPQTLDSLAAINILCLPYTLWSIWYQKFKAKTWCTLCVSVQATLWVLFAFYMIGGWTLHIFPMTLGFWIDTIVLCFCYGTLLLGINQIDNLLIKQLKKNENS